MQPILIVEDDPTQLSLYSIMLRRYPVRLAANGNDALGILQLETPSLVLLDMALPGVGGRELLQMMRCDTRLAAIKVIIMTAALTRVGNADQSLADKILVKPLLKPQLEAVIQEILA